MIVFLGPKEEQVPAPIGEDGAYQATGVAAGPNRVVVYYPSSGIKRKMVLKKGQTGSTEPMPALYVTPEKYANTETSGLTVDASPGKEFNVNMEGPPIP